MTVNGGQRPVPGDIFDRADDPIVNVTPGWQSDDYGEPALEAWLRHVKMATRGFHLPKHLREAEKQFPIIKEARSFLSPEDFVSLVGALAPRYRKGLRAKTATVV